MLESNSQWQEGYYRLQSIPKDSKGEWDRDISASDIGEVFYLYEVTDERLSLIYGQSYYHLSPELFVQHFLFAEDGLQQRSKQMHDIMQQLHESDTEQGALLAQSQIPAITDESDASVVESQSTDVMLIGSGRSAEQVKHSLKTVKTSAAKIRNDIATRQSQLSAFIEEQKLIMRKKQEALQLQVKKMEGAIDVINVYLGSHEQITRIRKGVAAPADEPISLRQSFLFMDEETALSKTPSGETLAEVGGIDFRTVGDFDKWIAKDANLNLCLPEQKGMVVFRVRRQKKNYGMDDLFQNFADDEDMKIYVLIRNGTNLHRIWTNLTLPGQLFPDEDEWENYFYKMHRGEREPLRPGSREYMEAMDAANEAQREYMKVLFMIQGLLDRTKVFQPLPEVRVNVCNLDHYNKYLRFVRDGERLLGDGRLDFSEWLSQANRQLERGCRIVGKFDSWYSNSSELGKRCYPKGERPEHLKIYEIEDVKDGAFIIRWKRSGMVYGDWYRESHEPKHRANMKLYRTDRFILNVDAVTIEEMEYYIHSRLHRYAYLEMIPLLLEAIKLKRQETVEEQPFRQLMIGEIAKAHNVKVDRAEEHIDELIQWWKFKNRHHRALICGDDAKALRMIVAEFGRRKKLYDQELVRSTIHIAVTLKLRKEMGDAALAIYHHKDNHYVMFCRHNKENIFVREMHWRRAANGEMLLDDDRTWRVLDSRRQSWRLIWHVEAFTKWKTNALPEKYLTDDEKKQYLEATIQAGRKKGLRPILIVAGSRFQDDTHLCVYCIQGKFHAPPEKHLLTGKLSFPNVVYFPVKWEKSAKGEVKFTNLGERQPSYFHSKSRMPWDKNYQDTFGDKSDCIADRKFLWVHEENKAALDKQLADYSAIKVRRDKLGAPLHELDKQLSSILMAEWQSQKEKEFLEEYVELDPDLFKNWLNRNDGDRPGSVSWMSAAAAYLHEVGRPIDSRTVEEVIEEAIQLGYKPKNSKSKTPGGKNYERLKKEVLHLHAIKSDSRDEWNEDLEPLD